MPTTPQLIKLHRRRREKYRSSHLQRGGLSLALILSITLLSGVIGVVVAYTTVTKNIPSIESLPTLLDPAGGLLLQPTRFYDRSGEHLIHTLQNPAIDEREYIYFPSFEREEEGKPVFSEHLLTATIAILDPTFWDNPGFSFIGIGKNEHSTIAQRLVSELLLWDEVPDLKRSIRERILAAQVIHHFGHEQIMEWLLNSMNFGSQAYGAGSAAQVYFGKSAADLNLKEAAILAAVSESPALNPFSAPHTALERGNIVIDAMEGQGLISSTEANNAKKTKVVFAGQLPSQNTLAPQFIDLTWQSLSKSIPIERVERGGYKIITTMDYDLQVQALCTTQIYLTRLTQQGFNQNPNQDPVYNLDNCPASKLLPTLTLDEELQPQEISANVIVYDPFNSQILALTGEGGLNKNSITDGRPAGSLLTPFVYLTALTRGFNPASLLWDIPAESLPEPLEQINPQGQYEGPMRLRNALAQDRLIPAIQLINQIGTENILKIARQLGLSSLALGPTTGPISKCPGCQLILNGGQTTLLEAVRAFGAFSNQGYLVGQIIEANDIEELQPLSPVSIISVMDYTNQILQTEHQVEVRPVISTQLAFLMTHMLSDESARWPNLNHPNPLEIGRPAGAKIGTTTVGEDTWSVGYTPHVVVGVWLGSTESSQNTYLPKTAAATLWHAIIKYASQDAPSDSWSMPPGITRMDVCDPSGMLPTLQCPNIVSEYFLSGQEPTQPDNLYRVYQVNRETGRLATVFSPPELVEERVYLNIPPEASSWADSVGLETPPDVYDMVDAPAMVPDAVIEYPEMFDDLNGIVTIQGRADGTGFVSYRLQAGAGINPSGWIVIQEETFSPEPLGILGTWNTTELNGLYAIQLIVLRENQRVDTATVQVTLDNEPPQVALLYPQDLALLSAEINETITFRVEASDNLGLDRIEYYLNGKLLSAQSQPPFAYPWNSRPGEISLKVIAIDNAGNRSETDITFKVE